MKMKQLVYSAGIAVIAVVFAVSAHGQTNQLGSLPLVNFFNQAANWGTSFDTNADHNWDASTLSLDTGIATVTGGNISDRLNFQYSKGSFSFGVMGEFQGVGSAFSEFEGIVQYSLIQKYDFKVGVTLGVGYDLNNNIAAHKGAFIIEPGLFASKVMTANTYATMSLTFPWESRGTFNQVPTVYVGVGTRF